MPSHDSTDRGWLAHYREVLGMWRRRAGNRADAEDAAHNAIARLLQTPSATIRDGRAYLSRSIANELSGQYRRERERPTSSLHELAEADHPAGDDAEASARCAQLSDALTRALRDLPPACQQVFAWHRLEGWTIPAIAAHMGLSVSSVEKYLARAIRHLQLRLRDFSP
ncbi:sigma-70 family RNA polymerase sigma factor [Achromobacter sp. GG226]|uniref:sigma-70 family RNA polymerase sigma factor n=1 Tax=Verticiella alkaliphila TaxID=2779529 RepID=UPI001C0DA99F|nr:sigma-70 family RNA polymerase sigma factor [Verticiella sp. GG226]MBU4610542.1 sigma-70 family RNA polymerase sigma factor [Verticiella sp. GG226]